MKYYKIEEKSHYQEEGMISPQANGDNVKGGLSYYRQIDNVLLESDSPVFDSFFLESYDKKKYWEWILCDIHKFTGEATAMGGGVYLVSPELKNIFESVQLVLPNRFYESKLMYKGDKIDRYIFHFSGNEFWKEKMKVVSFSESELFHPISGKHLIIDDFDSFREVSEKVGEEINYEYDLQINKLVINQQLDFLYLGCIGYETIVSERLKEKIERAGIVGFEFSELDYEVEVRES